MFGMWTLININHEINKKIISVFTCILILECTDMPCYGVLFRCFSVGKTAVKSFIVIGETTNTALEI